MAKLTREVFIEALKEMTILEIKDLVDAMKDEFGIDPTAVAAAPAGAVEVADAKVSVVIVSGGGNKMAVIKAVREITGLGLKESKELVDNGGAVKEGVETAEAKEVAATLEAAGATVEIK